MRWATVAVALLCTSSVAADCAPTGVVQFRIYPYATVVVGERFIGDTPLEVQELPAGLTHVTLINRELGVYVTLPLMVHPGANVLKVNLASLATRSTTSNERCVEARRERFGTVEVRARPWARVRVGALDLGETPVGAVLMPVGTTLVTLTNDELKKSVTVPVVVKPGVTRVRVNLGN